MNKRKQREKKVFPINDLYKNSVVVQNFQQYANELNDKHDRYERIFKISRDINIESKRLIFFLHTYQKGSANSEKILDDAKSKLIIIVESHFSNILEELYHKDAYQYLRAFSFGIQEFVEAFSFYYFLRNEQLLMFQDVVKFLNLYIQNPSKTNPDEIKCNILSEEKFDSSDISLSDVAEKNTNELTAKESDNMNEETKYDKQFYIKLEKNCVVTMTDYLLGLNDLTGELMRYCINQISHGQIEAAFTASQFVSNLYAGMLSLSFKTREYHRKMQTVEQSVKKVEMACYTVCIRGSEIPKHMIMNVLEKNDEEEIHF